MAIRLSSASAWRRGLAAALLAAGLALPSQAAEMPPGFAPGLTCNLTAPMAEASIQRIANRRRAKRAARQATPKLRAFFICSDLPGRSIGVGWRTSGPLRQT